MAATPASDQAFHRDRADRSVLVGRAREYATIVRLVESLHRGRGGLLVVEGDPGLGKSRLLTELILLAEDRAVRCVTGRCAPYEAGRPFGPLIDAFDLRARSLDPAAAEIGRLLDGQGAEGHGAVDGPAVAGAILDHIERARRHAPLLVVIDDLQWADPSTTRTLGELADAFTGAPIGIAVALRPSPRSSAVDALLERLARNGGETARLAPLDAEAVDELLSATAGAPAGPRLRSLAEGAGGCPLFIVELVAALRAERLLLVDAEAEATSDGVPVDLRAAVERRVRGLPAPTRELLRFAAALGTRFSLDELAIVAEHDLLVVAASLRPAFEDGLLGDDGVSAAFRHDLVRDAVYLSSPSSERAALHRQIGARLAESGAAPAHVAEHVAFGATVGDVAAVRWLRKAGLEAARHDAATAVDYLERAMALAPRSDPGRHRLVSELIAQLVLVGRSDEAEQLCRVLLAQTTDPTVEALVRIALGNLLDQGSRLDERRAEYLRAAAAVEEDNPLRLGARAAAGGVAVFAGDLDSGTAELSEVLIDSERAGHLFGQSLALSQLCVARACQGDLAHAVELGLRSELLSGEVDHHWAGFLHTHLYVAPVLAAADRLEEARSTLQVGRTLAVERRAPISVPAHDGLLAMCDYLEGRWDDAATLGVDAARRARHVGPGLQHAPGAAFTVLVAAARDDLLELDDECIELLHFETDCNAPFGGEYPHLAIAAMARGPTVQATTLWNAWESLGPFHLPTAGAVLGLALLPLCLTLEDRDGAAGIARDLELLANRAPGIRSLNAAALRSRGLVDCSPELLLRAVEVLEASPRPYERAAALADAGLALTERDPDRARSLVEHALQIYERLGAHRDTSQLEVRMRAVGITTRVRRRPERPSFGWDALTPAELRVVAAVSRGLTNGEVAAELYLSRYTIESHLKHIFTKLGIRSRAQLAAQGARRGR